MRDPATAASGASTSTGDPGLSLSTRFELLKNRRRRDVLEYLRAHGGESTLSDLAEHIAARENGIGVSQLSSDQRKRVYIGLYQSHLPKMDAAGVVDFDRDRGTVVLREEAEQVFEFLDDGTRRTDRGPATTVRRAVSRERVRPITDSALVAAIVGVIGIGLLASFADVPAAVLVAFLAGSALVVLVAVARDVVGSTATGRGSGAEEVRTDTGHTGLRDR